MTHVPSSRSPWLAALFFLLMASPIVAQAGGEAAGPRSVDDGVYTQEQAERGETAFRQNCASCHTAGEFTGEMFIGRWATVGSLFDLVSATMPQDFPGGLRAEQYADVLAYVLSQNEFPAGSVELPGETSRLGTIRIQPPR
jgi:mono/diheme cytochrome c family protein